MNHESVVNPAAGSTVEIEVPLDDAQSAEPQEETRLRRLRVLEWAGCGLGLLGAFLLATHSDVSRYGWIAFLLANFAVIGFARGIRAHGLLVQQLGFMGTSVLGLARAFWPHV